MATYILKRILRKLFSGIGRSGYPQGYTPGNIENTKNIPIVYDISRIKSFQEDLSKHVLKPSKARIKKLIKSIKNGNIYKNDPNDPDEYTHPLPGANISGYEVYSKDIDHSDRFVYGVKKPYESFVGGIKSLVVPILLIENYGHDDDQEIKNRINGNKKK